ncbi:MAG: hypothetical protein WCE65_05535 [Methanoregula sp.]
MIMVLIELREAVRTIRQAPILWVPGVVAGLLGAVLWILLNISGMFFASKLVVIACLAMIFFVAGTLSLIRKKENNVRVMLQDGIRYYFRVLLPELVICFVLLLVFVTITMVTSISSGGSVNFEITGSLAILVMIPTLFVTFFCDTAAVFEDLQVFKSLRRSVSVVASHAGEVLGFYVICCLILFIDFFVFAIIWEGLLFDKLEPLTHYNQTQIAAVTPQQLIALVGTNGMWVTAIVIFLALLVLVPLLLTYKACFYRAITQNPTPGAEPSTGEFDSKGRWYKY